MRILFAEDCSTQRLVLQAVLRRDGHDVEAFSDGEAALRAAAAAEYDCFVTDWSMPGLDGLACVRRMRALPRESHLHVIMVTGRGERQDRLEAIDAGVDDFIEKPVDADELRARLRTAERQQRVYADLRRQLAERFALRESVEKRERSYRDLFAKSPEPTAIVEADGRVADANRAWCAALGLGSERIVGAQLVELATEDGREACAALLRALEEREAVEESPLRVVGAGGVAREFVASGVKLSGGGGVPVRYVLRAVDVTERRRRDAAVRDRERLASVGSLMRGMAAEISEPLALARSNVGALARYVERLVEHGTAADAAATAALKDERAVALEKAAIAEELRNRLKVDFIRKDAADLLSRTQRCMERVRTLVSDVRNFTATHDVTTETDVGELVRTAVNLSAAQFRGKAELVLDLQPAPKIRANAPRLAQAFVNVLINAAEAVEQGGFVKVSTWTDGTEAAVRVSDDGRGVPPENLTRVFEPFFTTKPLGEGAGLGLNVTYNVVLAHEGTVKLASTPGKGTTVDFRFPPARASVAEGPAPARGGSEVGEPAVGGPAAKA
jgi:PAS domain S-box-containing protein